MLKIFAALFLLLVVSGCLYKMPTERNISTLPNVNNPTYTRERPATLLPGQG